jgi:alcohol dehydrogenase class IV
MTTIWSFPTRIVFGAGEVRRAGDEAKSFGISRALLVTDAGVVSAGLHQAVSAALERAGLAISVFSGIDSNPTEANIEAGARAYAKHGADGVIGVGGGSPMDAAKLIAVRARSTASWTDLDDSVGGGALVPADLPPVVLVPTTAGTGSEVGRAAVLTVRSTGRKTVVFSPRMLARAAILDPELTVSMPAKTTAATGFDALTHCIEAYLARGDHPMADAIALAGIDLVVNHLRRAVEHGNDLVARGAMLKAAMMGAVAFQKGLGACHSLAHPLSSECGLHHGLANALCLPAVLDYNEPVATERVAHVGLLLGAEAARGGCGRAVAEFRRSLGLPTSLSEARVGEALLPKLAGLAFQDACHRDNPRECTEANLLALYRDSF